MNVTWALAQDDFNESDRLWCHGLGVKVKMEPLFGKTYSYGKLVNEVITGWKIRLHTNNKKQENMLKLKYGPRLVEVQRSRNCTPDELKELDF